MVTAVNIVFAPTGQSFLLEMRREETPTRTTGLPLQRTSLSPERIFISDVMKRIRDYALPSATDAIPLVGDRRFVECFDYGTLQPLRAHDPVSEGQKLLLFASPHLSNVLTERLSGLRPWPQDEGSKLPVTGEERWANLRQACLALDVPPLLHRNQMEQEMNRCTEKVKDTAKRFQAAKEGIEEALESIKDINIFRGFDSPLMSFVDANGMRMAAVQGEVKLCEAAKCIDDARAMAPEVIRAIVRESQITECVQASESWRTFSTPDEHAGDSSVVAVLMQEVGRKLVAVRSILTKIGKITRQQSKCRRYCEAVLHHVVHRQRILCQLPQGVEAAERLLERRITLRRAIRRLILPLEAEHRSLERDIQYFLGKWRDCLPDDLFGAVTTPLPALYPPEDTVAHDMDRYFLDVGKDEAEELLQSISMAPGTSPIASSAVEAELRDVEDEVQRCEVALRLAIERRDALRRESKQHSIDELGAE
uniref:Uncharacterized protein TCIL3000_10_8210 n=1 Tax=Trypanosoma congolense (strain IL3000) TaxID=1068625 RepID=G0UXC8_TRYCI|nr:unnamed protein product [Trypanosoma congolense IL3000]